MHQELLLVDFENVQPADIAHLKKDCAVIIFMGAKQDSIRDKLANSIRERGTLVEFQKVDAVRNNALDFHIACHLGRILERSPEVHCTVLSKDKGFDPLLRYLKRNGLKCRRIENLSEIAPMRAPANDPKYTPLVSQRVTPRHPTA